MKNSGNAGRTLEGVRLEIALPALAGAVALALPVSADQRGYLMPVIGRVVSVNHHRGTIVLHHGMLETLNPGDETCVVPRGNLQSIHPGMDVSAVADTRHRPWHLHQVHRFRADRPHSDPGGAAVAESALVLREL